MKNFLRFLFFVSLLKRVVRSRESPEVTAADHPKASSPQHSTEKRRPSRRWLFTALGVLILLGIGGLLVAVTGIIPLKASAGHWAVTRWFLDFSKHRSVATHTFRLEAPALNDPAMVLKGAGHFETACAPCHGSPHRAQPRVAQHMLPPPPPLGAAVPEWDPEELFYIVKHGIKFTGMPAWPAKNREDEIWAVVAFLLQLPNMPTSEYLHLSGIEVPEGAPIEKLQTAEGLPDVIKKSCARCHGQDGLGRGLGAFPKLAGQKPEYLRASLEAYAQGKRASGIMEPLAKNLDAKTIEQISTFYSSLPAKAGVKASKPPDPEALERGRAIAHSGVPQKGVPACVECHSHGSQPRNPVYPQLAGQYSDYLVLQLQLFQKSARGGTPYSHIMELVAKRLTPEQMSDVALYWASASYEESAD